jgi:hypothetical protein
MEEHSEIVRLTITYTLLGAFVFTVLITCGSLIGVVRFADSKQQKRLFTVLIVEIVIICLGVFADFLKFDPLAVERGIVDKTVPDGQLSYYKRANTFLPNIGKLINETKTEVLFCGVSFYVTLPEHRDAIITKVRSGVKVRFIVFDHTSSRLDEVAASFHQSAVQLKSECQSTIHGLKSIRDDLEGSGFEDLFEVWLVPHRGFGRYYFFDPSTERARCFFIPLVHGLNSPNVPGFLSHSSEDGVIATYYQSCTRMLENAVSFDEWLQANQGEVR